MKNKNKKNTDVLMSFNIKNDNSLKSEILKKDYISEKKEILDNSFNSLDLLKNDILDEKLDKSKSIGFIEKIKLSNKKLYFVIAWIKATLKYLASSTLIFSLLLFSTNYSAYINLAKSYINKTELEATEQNIISSVAASNIKEKYKIAKLKEIDTRKTTALKEDRLSIKKMKKQQDKKNLDLNIEITPYQNRVIVPSIGKNIPLIDIKNKNISWEKELNSIFNKELENGIIRYPGSAKPGDTWNSFIFGHSSNFPWMKWDYNEVFALLWELKIGDEIIVYYNQEKYTYVIKEQNVIKPGDVSILKRDKNKKELTLMTCWPIGTTLNRLIVTWELVK